MWHSRGPSSDHNLDWKQKFISAQGTDALGLFCETAAFVPSGTFVDRETVIAHLPSAKNSPWSAGRPKRLLAARSHGTAPYTRTERRL